MSGNVPTKQFNPQSLGFFPELVLRVKLILRLLSDSRVNPLIKVLPVFALIYWVVPTDLMPGLPFDDAAVLWFGGALFLELCPQDVVQEHTNALRLEAERAEALRQQEKKHESSVVDAEFREVVSDKGETRAEDHNAP
jgi:hypothetical protein